MNKIRDWINLVENDNDHQKALNDTGFWGAQGAGCIIFARETKRFLFAKRSRHVEQPGDFGGWGGAIDSGELPKDAALREVHEETGYNGDIEILPMYVFTKGTFRYSNFLAIVEEEYDPRLDWENSGFVWTLFGEWPSPLHFGIKALLNDPASYALMKSYADKN